MNINGKLNGQVRWCGCLLNGKIHRVVNVGINGPVIVSLGRPMASSVQINGVGEWGEVNRIVSEVNSEVNLI